MQRVLLYLYLDLEAFACLGSHMVVRSMPDPECEVPPDFVCSTMMAS
jgi:hypothetical protein